jgi:hypothetical protein
MSLYEFFPAYIFPWLNSVSIPVCYLRHGVFVYTTNCVNSVSQL